MSGLLDGVVVIEFAQLLPGPFCGLSLADLGATVTKVEPPGGDACRRLDDEMYAVVNRNKTIVELDMKSEQDKCDYFDLVAGADVVLEGYRTGVADRLGVGYDAARERRPGLIYCAISGYGQDVPGATDPGHDVNFLANGGGLALPGAWGTEPTRPAIPLGDLLAAHRAAELILASLLRRSRTGEGAYLDVAIADAVLAASAVRAGRTMSRIDGANYLAPANGLYVAGDGGRFVLGALEDKFWAALVALLEEPALLDPAFATLNDRRKHGDRIEELLHEAFVTASAAGWVTRLKGAGVPADMVLSVSEAADLTTARGRRIVQSGDNGRYVLYPAYLDGSPVARLRHEVGSG